MLYPIIIIACPNTNYVTGYHGVCFCYGKSRCDPVHGDSTCPSSSSTGLYEKLMKSVI